MSLADPVPVLYLFPCACGAEHIGAGDSFGGCGSSHPDEVVCPECGAETPSGPPRILVALN